MRKNRKESFLNKYYNKYFNYKGNHAQFNIYLLISVVAISFIGLMVLFSASSYLTIKYDTSKFYYVGRQAIFLFISIIVMFLISKIHYKFYKDHAFLFYLIGISFLILCYVPFFSVTTNGARRHIKLIIQFMPSDFAKLTTLIFLCKYLVENRGKMGNIVDGFIKVAGIILIPFALVLFQTDLSTSIVILLSTGIVFLLGGFRLKFLPILIVAGIIFVLGLYFGLEEYQLNRITAFINPEEHYGDLSWQVLNGLFAVSRGGLAGQGYGKSIYKHGYLSNEVNNDMIFAVIAEEFGFIGSVIFVAFVFLITYQVIKVALKAKDEYAKLLCFGIGMVYFIQSMINIGVSISIIPNTGITLPFVSNGGTSLLAFCIMFGIVLNISRINNHQEKLDLNKTDNIV